MANTQTERTVGVAAESRVYVVDAEGRTVAVDAESRVFVVAARVGSFGLSYRLTWPDTWDAIWGEETTAPAARALVVPAESRVLEVTQ